MTTVMTEDPLWGHPQVAWLTRVARRLRRVDQARPWVLDTALVLAALLVFGLLDLRTGRQHVALVRTGGLPPYGIVALQLGLILPLLWRRRAPSAVLGAVLAVFLVQWSLDVSLHSDIALFIALYSLARHGRLRHLGFGCAAVLAALGLAAVRVPVPLSPLVALFFLGSAATAAVALGLGIRLGWAYLVALRDRAARLELERDQRSRLAAAAERARIAREMHDIVGHNLAVIIGLADGGADAVDFVPQRGKQALQLIAGTGRQALGELRRTLAVLREAPGQDPPDVTMASELSPQPGIAGLDALCERVRAAGPQVHYRTVGQPEALGAGIQLAVYRIVQEALTNTLKHAGTDTNARLTVAAEGEELHVRVEDTGPAGGLPQPAHHPPTDPEGEGHGIAGMRERAALYGGTVTAGPRPGGGWAVDAAFHLTTAGGSPLPRTDSPT
ncbi:MULTISPECIES: sensor histidine kinase [Streptomyces]|uniref:histidine kinase n=1 Tax=Streptomyces zinciresistens K42 TaxID=700597 RepID=G2G602_9ACTN|nr:MULTISPECIES: histidine kinase [Streptomyces]EGX61091.1 two-component system histidine kinase [Streptomyces zinciresistens K42]MDT9696614.1 histidine kinase [Streptomyces sp. P17]